MRCKRLRLLLKENFLRCVSAMRGLLKRERRYDDPNYSVPIGSRYRPERAPIWQAQDTEREPGPA